MPMFLQVTQTYTIDPSWLFGSIISVMLVIIGYFLANTLKELKLNHVQLSQKVDNHEDKINDHETRLQLKRQRIEQLEDNIGEMNQKLADEIVRKIRSITP